MVEGLLDILAVVLEPRLVLPVVPCVSPFCGLQHVVQARLPDVLVRHHAAPQVLVLQLRVAVPPAVGARHLALRAAHVPACIIREARHDRDGVPCTAPPRG